MNNDREWASDLTPNSLFKDLHEYREVFGVRFTLKELLEIQRIKALNRIAAAITDLPELLGHEAVLAANAGLFSDVSTEGIAKAINNISDTIDHSNEK